ncbi:MAG: hypothetical protein AB7L84_08730 [Acidimicrobiia bacterium]
MKILGMIVPGLNVLAEQDLHLMRPSDCWVASSRYPFDQEGSFSSIEGAVAAAAPALVGMPLDQVDVLGYACTAASFQHGRAAEAGLVAGVQHLAGAPIPVVTAAGGVARALAALGAARAALVTPYTDAHNARLAGFLVDHGVEVVFSSGLQITVGEELSKVPLDTIRGRVAEAATHRPDLIVTPCTAFPVTTLIAELEARHGIPIVAANQAMLWAAARIAGSTATVDGYGALWARPCPAPSDRPGVVAA